jgi:chemotaxis protein methyltransferase CheR
MDRKALAMARDGGPYIQNDIKNVTPERREKYFDTVDDKYFVKAKYKGKVKFIEQNLLTEPFENDLDLIVCRNVIIYFTNEAKELLFAKFHNALKPGGILFLGGTEIISRPREIGFTNFDVSFYRKE